MKIRLALQIFACLVAATGAQAQSQAEDPLPSWNDGPARQAILNFVHVTTGQSGPYFVPPQQRIAVFDQDGTTWVEHPVYTQFAFAVDQVDAQVETHPDWQVTQPFMTALSGNQAAIAKLSLKNLRDIFLATHDGLNVDEFNTAAKSWIVNARDRRWNRPYTDLVYQPMLEVMRYLRANGYKTFILTGGGQDFVRAYSQQAYGIPPEQVIGSARETQYKYNEHDGQLFTQPPKQLMNDPFSGKPEDVYLFTGQRPRAAFGNSTGDRELLEYTQAGGGALLIMLVLHDDAAREYAYGPAQGLPDTTVGSFTQGLYDEARKKGWIVISMKKDWKRIFAFEPQADAHLPADKR